MQALTGYLYLTAAMNQTKISLSATELELVCNTEWLLTKHAVIAKVYSLLGNAAHNMQNTVNKNKHELPEVVLNSSPKISKGENYMQLPYVMLDYPRHFAKEDTLAIRTFFWWGNFFSVTLQLAGSYKEERLQLITDNFSFLQENNYWICSNTDQWQHHFSNDNYVLLKDISKGEFLSVLNREAFVKLAKKTALTEWQTAQGFIEKTFAEMLKIASNQAPSL